MGSDAKLAWLCWENLTYKKLSLIKKIKVLKLHL